MTTWTKNLNRIFYKFQNIGETSAIRYVYSIEAFCLEVLKSEPEKELNVLKQFKNAIENNIATKARIDNIDDKVKEIKNSLQTIDLFMGWEAVYVPKAVTTNSVCFAV